MRKTRPRAFSGTRKGAIRSVSAHGAGSSLGYLALGAYKSRYHRIPGQRWLIRFIVVCSAKHMCQVLLSSGPDTGAGFSYTRSSSLRQTLSLNSFHPLHPPAFRLNGVGLFCPSLMPLCTTTMLSTIVVLGSAVECSEVEWMSSRLQIGRSMRRGLTLVVFA